MIRKIAGIIIISALLILAGCKQDKDNTTLSPYYYDYAPVNVGHTVIYDVDSVRFNYLLGDSQQVDTFHYQLKVLVQDTFYDVNGKVNYRMETYKRIDTTQPFVIDHAWYCLETRNTFEIVEFDLHFIKLVFPPIRGANWQGNSYLPANDTVADTYQPYAGWTYTFTSVNVPAIVNGMRFDSTAIVTEINTEPNDKVYGALSRNTYARHIGLIYREWEILDKQDIQSSYDYPNQTNGFRIRMRIHSYTP
jgi:hypothetical protein